MAAQENNIKLNLYKHRNKTLFLTLSSVVLLFVVWTIWIDGNNFVSILDNIKLLPFLGAIFFSIVAPFLNTSRWYFLIRLADFYIPFPKVFSLTMAAWTISPLPGRVGDFLRSFPIKKEIPITISTGTIVLEKVIDILSLLILSFVGMCLLGLWLPALIILSAILSIIIILTNVKKYPNLFPPKIQTKIKELLTVADNIKFKPKFFLLAIIISLLNWLSSILTILFLLLSFSNNVPLSILLSYVPLAIFMGILPISIAGVGTRDGALLLLLSPFATESAIFASGIGYSFLNYFLFALLGIPFFLRELHKMKK